MAGQLAVTYIENNKNRTRYAKVRKSGLPIGSGVTESTAKNVVNMRANRSGQLGVFLVCAGF